MNKNLKIWGAMCGISILIILTPLWATLTAIVLGTSLPWLTEFITSVDKYIAIIGVVTFVISICQFSREFTRQHQNVE